MQTRTTPGAMLKAMREKPPLVQCITNYVAMNIAANVLLASGASPAMVHAAEEAGEFAGIASALTINIGTLSTQWIDGMQAAAKAATSAGKPWVLDPVAHYATAFRRNAVADLLALRPTIIRGNASEIIALAGGESRGQGVDSRDPVEQAEGSARWLAERQRAVVAVTGAVDFVTDGEKAVRIEGGSALMPQVTALGCSLTCLVGAFAATAPEDIFGATVATLATFAIAGEEAALGAAGPGSFSWRFLDALAALDPETLDARARISAA
ncbi:hydroxyethylthiazole kinase [Rhizobium leguminosarum]|uniref:Hydroxyethylthiazole kinase n=1 Tax=Rhizobium leguminosarum TaxID=384 RepID=A0A444I4H9_RHILE|nr:hydroxyethylthiazole kinase [Rhizobium leguminosarum]MDH6662828.1 hydroxyethylthiazole kinase [Rhizobium sophorae]ASS59243.1 hydroxyethylthiazole kinase [Rhizobium leguminosarum bv. viciae]MBB4331947.1 hydroxyethylthiazole kinase [Rhizobium leguminosarum]MBB4345820.1 hydroxyethylthiazole kinase [Rhizobium leguminosarum]MBB4357572.1 hydroxyethylthiazole kinase [Rhizobium leguminosarum]